MLKLFNILTMLFITTSCISIQFNTTSPICDPKALLNLKMNGLYIENKTQSEMIIKRNSPGKYSYRISAEGEVIDTGNFSLCIVNNLKVAEIKKMDITHTLPLTLVRMKV